MRSAEFERDGRTKSVARYAAQSSANAAEKRSSAEGPNNAGAEAAATAVPPFPYGPLRGTDTQARSARPSTMSPFTLKNFGPNGCVDMIRSMKTEPHAV